MNPLAVIVAASENNVIGNEDDLPWRLSADLVRFKKLTMGHHIVMGRKTYDSIGRLLPGRTTVIVTRQADYRIEGAKIANTWEQAMQHCADDDLPFVVGGGEIYATAITHATQLHLTRVHATIEGDTKLPAIDWDQWTQVSQESHSADSKNEFDVTFEVYHRIL